jgi:hypothetical protein
MKNSNNFIAPIAITLTVLILTGGFIVYCAESKNFEGPDVRTGNVFDLPEKPIDRTQSDLASHFDSQPKSYNRPKTHNSIPNEVQEDVLIYQTLRQLGYSHEEATTATINSMR